MIGERLRILRRNAGLTQEALAEILDVAKDSISKYENDRSVPGDDFKLKVANYFNVSLDYLLGAIDTPEPLHREELVLPKAFPKEAMSDLNEMIYYLMYKHGMDEETKRMFELWTRIGPSKKRALLKLMDETE